MAPIRPTPSTSKTSPLPYRNQTSPNNTSSRITRQAEAAKAAEALTAWKSITRHVGEMDVHRAQDEAAHSPTVLCYDATTIGGLPPLSPDGEFGPAIKLIHVVARLLLNEAVRQVYTVPLTLIHRRSFEASNQFSVRHPDKRLPGHDYALEFVTKRFPKVVFHETVRESWGSVNKAECEGADRNEMFISKDLVLAYIDTQTGRQPCAVTEEQYAKVKRYVEFVFIATILHEFGHCLTKDSFGPNFLTPCLPPLVGVDQRGSQRLGEIGQDVEMGIFGCIAVFEWDDSAVFYSDPRTRLWHVDRVLGQRLKSGEPPEWYHLIDAQIDHVIHMVNHGYVDQMIFDHQRDVGGATGKAIRAKSAMDGMRVMEQQDNVEDEAPSALDFTDAEDLPGLGLRITLNPTAFRFVPHGDRRLRDFESSP